MGVKVLDKPSITIEPELCKGCGLCIWACPKEEIRLSDKDDIRGIKVAFFNDSHECTGCTFCAVVCPEVAIDVYRASSKG